MSPNHSPTAPFLRIRPDRLAPFVLTCEHARHGLPKGLRPGPVERRILKSHWGWDPGAWALTRNVASRLRTGATGGRWSRLWIDLNRAAGDPTLVRPEVEGHPLSWNAGVGDGETAARYAEVHVAYHAEIDREIAHRVLHGVQPVLLAFHSYTPEWNGRPRRYDAGVLYDESRAEAIQLVSALRDAGLTTRYNEPYSGRAGLMYSIDRHGRHYRLPCLELEINQALFERPETVPRIGRIVATALTGIEARLRKRR